MDFRVAVGFFSSASAAVIAYPDCLPDLLLSL